SRRFRCLIAGSVSAVTLIVNWLTMAPTVTLVDSGELIVASSGLGVAHPPGFPLYCMLAHFATFLPFGSKARRVYFPSALFAGLAAGVVCLIVAEVMLSVHSRGPKPKVKGRARKAEPPNEAIPNTGLLGYLAAGTPCIFAGLTLAFSRTLWGYATIAEVYTLNSLLIAMILLLMLRWRRARTAAAQGNPTSGARAGSEILPQSRSRDAYLYTAALLFGLALGVHHVTVGLLLPGLAALVYAAEGFSFFRSKKLLVAAMVSIAGLV